MYYGDWKLNVYYSNDGFVLVGTELDKARWYKVRYAKTKGKYIMYRARRVYLD